MSHVPSCPGGRRSGFTLIELLVVISIIAVLAVIGMAVFTGVQKGARDAKRRGDIQAISRALEIYYATNGHYPIVSGGWGAVSCDSSWDAFASLLAPYMQSLPRDPINDCSSWTGGKFYKYHNRYNPSSPNDGSVYQIAASLEDTSQATGNFTLWCATADCTACWVNLHTDVPTCIFNKTKGGFGYDSQQ